MLHQARNLQGDAIVAKDGPIGELKDLYFDDERWAVRYLVVDTGRWLPGRKLLLSPACVDSHASTEDEIKVALTREQVEHAPGIEADKPVSRQYEEAHARYYGYPEYWAAAGMAGVGPIPPPAAETGPQAERALKEAERKAEQSHLRSTAEVMGYAIEAADGTAGRIDDFMVDDQNWRVDALLVDTREWVPGGRVLVSPSAIERIDWMKRAVRVRMTREAIKQSARVFR
jgi:sporulation protein YlmC with PRC-barrel domain